MRNIHIFVGGYLYNLNNQVNNWRLSQKLPKKSRCSLSKVAQKESQEFLQKWMFFKKPKTYLILGLLLWGNFALRPFINSPIRSHCLPRQHDLDHTVVHFRSSSKRRAITSIWTRSVLDMSQIPSGKSLSYCLSREYSLTCFVRESFTVQLTSCQF